MYVRIELGKELAIPNSFMLRNEIKRSTKMLTHHKGRTCYIGGVLDFDVH